MYMNQIPSIDEQYLDISTRIINEGVDTFNERTGQYTRMLIGETITFAGGDDVPFEVISLRKSPIKMPTAELIGYLKGLTNAQDFADLGANTWFANANENQAWLNNPYRKGENDLGYIYGAVARCMYDRNGNSHDQLAKVVNDLKNGVDDRAEIFTFLNLAEVQRACLKPCLHTFQMNIFGDQLCIEAYMRSTDTGLGLVANIQGVQALREIMCHMTGLKKGRARLHMSNVHIYHSHLDAMRELIQRKPLKNNAKFVIKKPFTLEDFDDWVTTDNFEVVGYDNYHPAMGTDRLPFAV